MTAEHTLTPHEPTPGSPTGVTAAQAAAFLRRRFGEDVRGVARLGRGEWSAAFAFRHAGRGYVARFSALEEDFAKDRIAERYRAPALPIPRVIMAGEALGGFYAVSERAYGVYLDDLGATRMRAALPALFAALDAAADADVSATEGYGLWDAGGSAPHPSWRAALLDAAVDHPTRRTHGWRERLAESPLALARFEEGVACLPALVDACPEERHLIHADLLNANVLVRGTRLTAVLDWGCAMYGDFLYDLAWLCFWSPWYPAWQGIDFQLEAARHYEATGRHVPRLAGRLRCYQVHIGLDGQAYAAFKGRWQDVHAIGRRTLEVAGSGR